MTRSCTRPRATPRWASCAPPHPLRPPPHPTPPHPTPKGFPQHHDWILYAPEGDAALGLRNWLAYGASNRMGRYASRTRYAEVFLVQVRGAWGAGGELSKAGSGRRRPGHKGGARACLPRSIGAAAGPSAPRLAPPPTLPTLPLPPGRPPPVPGPLLGAAHRRPAPGPPSARAAASSLPLPQPCPPPGRPTPVPGPLLRAARLRPAPCPARAAPAHCATTAPLSSPPHAPPGRPTPVPGPLLGSLHRRRGRGARQGPGGREEVRSGRRPLGWVVATGLAKGPRRGHLGRVSQQGVARGSLLSAPPCLHPLHTASRRPSRPAETPETPRRLDAALRK
jgi:hypothetical protein